MDQARLALLRAVADHGSITAAAAATRRTPSAASQQIKALERESGRALVQRHGRRIRLTDAGVALVEASRRVATAVAEFEAEWAAWQHAPAGEVSIAVFPSAAELLMPALLGRLSDRPELTVTLIDRDVAQDEFAAVTKEADLVLAHRGDDLPVHGRRGVRVQSLVVEPLDVAIPLAHRLADRASVTCAEVIDEQWIGVPPSYPLDRLLTAVSMQAGRPAHHVQRTVNLALTERLVAAGLGVALLPRYVTQLHAPAGLRLVPLADVRVRRHIEVLARPERLARGAVQAVRAELVATAREVIAAG